MNEVSWVLLNPCVWLLLPAVGGIVWYRRARRRIRDQVRDERWFEDGWLDR